MHIDKEFDAQFYFGDMQSDIEKMDYEDFKKKPITIREKHFFKKILWRKDLLSLPFKPYKHYLVIGDSNLSYFPFVVLCKMMGKKVYAWGHGYKKFKGIYGKLFKWLYKQYDVYFTYGEKGRDRLIDLGIPPRKLEVIYNSLNEGVDPNCQRLYKSEIVCSHFNNGYPTLLFVGRLTKVKQLDWIIKAQAHHKSLGLFYNVLIIGDGEEREKLEDLVTQNQLQSTVWFYGKCYDEEELSTLLYNVDLCVSPGNVGLTALHAMTYGTPVISHDDFESQMPEYETIIPGKTGDLYKKGDFEDFCLKIQKWFSNSFDREQIRNHCHDVINGKYNSLYQIQLLLKIIN